MLVDVRAGKEHKLEACFRFVEAYSSINVVLGPEQSIDLCFSAGHMGLTLDEPKRPTVLLWAWRQFRASQD